MAFAAIAKKATPKEPYIIANEYLCNHLARTLLLPCPPGALLVHNDESYFATLNFNVGGLSLPPANPSRIVSANPSVAWGVILFDVLAMNEDRHVGNISHDRATDNIQIFDHSHAFAGPSGPINMTVTGRVDRLSIGGHCLAHEIDRADGFQMWCERIKALPDFFIKGVVEEACALGIPPAHNEECVDAIRKRRDEIDLLVKNNLASFPKLPGDAL